MVDVQVLDGMSKSLNQLFFVLIILESNDVMLPFDITLDKFDI